MSVFVARPGGVVVIHRDGRAAIQGVVKAAAAGSGRPRGSMSVSGGSQYAGGFAHLVGLDPENAAVAALAGAQRLQGDDVDAGGGQTPRHLGYGAGAIVALDEEGGLLFSEDQPGGFGRLD